MIRNEYAANQYLAQRAATMARLQPTAGEMRRAIVRRQQSLLARMVRAIISK
jgi:hypothetical protein